MKKGRPRLTSGGVSKDGTTINVGVTRAMLNALHRDAKASHRSISEQVRAIIHVRFAANLDPDRILAALDAERRPLAEVISVHDVGNHAPHEAHDGQGVS